MSYIGKTPQIGGYHKLDNITCDGSTAYTMQLNSSNFSPESVNHMIVSVNGVIQAPTTSYTISSSTITFASALTSSDTIDFIMCLGNVLDIGTPSDGTVSLSKLSATGTPSASTFLRGDNSWASAGGDNTPYFFAYLSSNQSTTSGASQKVNFNSKRYDSASAYDNTTNYRYTPTTAGYYHFFTAVTFYADADQFEKNNTSIRLNGSTIAEGDSDHRFARTRQNTTYVNAIQYMNGTTDYVEVYAFVMSATSGHYINSGNDTYFGGYKLIT